MVCARFCASALDGNVCKHAEIALAYQRLMAFTTHSSAGTRSEQMNKTNTFTPVICAHVADCKRHNRRSFANAHLLQQWQITKRFDGGKNAL